MGQIIDLTQQLEYGRRPKKRRGEPKTSGKITSRWALSLQRRQLGHQLGRLSDVLDLFDHVDVMPDGDGEQC